MKYQQPKTKPGNGFEASWLLAATVALLLQACAQQPVVAGRGESVAVSAGASECRDLLGVGSAAGNELDASSITLFSWNVRKKRTRGWSDDFSTYADGADLVLFQEASIREETIAELDSSRHWSFAPGWIRKGEATGVMTLSGVAPITRCSLVHSEPWLRTPKATSITEYGLSGTDKTLVVVNMHAVNFTFGTEEFERQFGEIRHVLEDHDGPIILSGDLNTWRQKRQQIVDELADSLQLQAVNFDHDVRVRFLGSTLDHVFVRGLQTLGADTQTVETSDHNPMSVVLSL